MSVIPTSCTQTIYYNCASECNETYIAISSAIKLPCFRNCGIMIGNQDLKEAHNAIPPRSDDAYNHFIADDIVVPTTNMEWELHGGMYYIVVYTDGSCYNPTCKYLSRAGWGVFYAIGCQHNGSGHIYGPLQTSYRAEVRAVLEVIRTAANPTSIICDCESVVNIMQSIIQRQHIAVDDLSDSDLWRTIKDLHDDAPVNYFRCTWVPSHCDDEGNEEKRRLMLESGTITEAQIRGNDMADELAKQGAAKHQVSERTLRAQEHRKQITMVYQNMMVTIWDKHFEKFTQCKDKQAPIHAEDDLPNIPDMIR
jgi:ribonuclease HI